MLKKVLLGLLILILVVAIGGFLYYRLAIYTKPLISDNDRAEIKLMPLPASLELGKGEIDLSDGISISFVNVQNGYLSKTAQRFAENLELIYEVTTNENGAVLEINCFENAASDIPQFGDDESYTLIIDKQISLTANTQFGINHGLETILQLIQKNESGIILPKLEIQDSPRFPWRGVMLDVCRHWMPKEVVLRTIDAMAAVKMNVFHWHLSEDQGFRVESKVFPKLHEVGSNGKYYTQDDIREIVAYAAERGIRVIPEFDVPGHSKSWQIAYPELGTLSTELTFANETGELFSPPMDPTKEIVYEFLDKFIEEMVNLFPDAYFHIGGDEVDPKFWNESESVQKFMKLNGIKDAHELQAYFNTRIYQLVKKHGRTMVGWEEIMSDDLEGDIIIQSWRGQKSLFEAVQNGKRGILSAGWYLDLKLHSDKHYAVDPLVLPGAVDMEPDSMHWKSYRINLDIPSGTMETKLVLFDRDPDNIYGFMEFMGDRAGFKNGQQKGNQLSFELESQMGKLNFAAGVINDSISGKLSLALFKFDVHGKQMAGSDIEGTKLPKIEVVKPLTEEQKSMILGGEAAMWSEVVAENNVDSRIWPRTATIAEKLWSPAVLTANTEDMFRRLEHFSSYLIARGNPFFEQQDQILADLVSPEGLPYLKTLVQQLEEVKYYERLASLGNIYGVYLPDLPMDGIVDAARPESLSARKFNKMVEDYIAAHDEELKLKIKEQLQLWSKNHEQLNPWLDTEELHKVADLSEAFSRAAEQSLNYLSDGFKPSEQAQQELQQNIDFLERGEKGVLCAVAEGFRKLSSL